MAEIIPINFALYGFEKEQEVLMQASFASADKWAPPWQFTDAIENARVVFVYLATESDFGLIDKLTRDLPQAEIVAFSSKKPMQAKWHLERKSSGKASIVGFSQLVLKLSHSLKRNAPEAKQSQLEQATMPSLAEPKLMAEPMPSANSDNDYVEQEDDVVPFFNILDSLLDTKPNDKRKRFNES